MIDTDKYYIKSYTEEDHNKYIEFCNKVWMPPSMKRSENWFRWIMYENPECQSREKPLLLAYYENTIVGMLVLTPTRLFSYGKEYNVAWGRDLYVDPNHRRSKIGVLIVKAWSDLFDMALGAGVSENASNMYKKYGWTFHGSVNQYEKILVNIKVLRSVCDKGIRKIVVIMLAMIYSFIFSLLNRRYYNIEVAEVKMFNESLDALWNKAKMQYPNICKRDLATLEWKYIRHPYHQYKIFEAKDSNAYKGYIVVRIEDKDTAKIVDILTEENDDKTRKVLISHVEGYLHRKGISKIICWCKCSRFENALVKSGYIRTYLPCDFVFNSVSVKCNEYCNNWYITSADSDLDR